MNINIKLCGGRFPEYKHATDACADCYTKADSLFIVAPMETVKVPLGFCLELPEDYEAVIRPRSGLSSKGILVHIGTIDSGYRGEVMTTVTNLSDSPFKIEGETRICQLKIQKAEQFTFTEKAELSESDRGSDGFGSTGLK